MAAIVLAVVAMVAPEERASAQTTTTTSSGLSVQVNPNSLVTHKLPNGDDFTRNSTLNPTGINFEDCERDVVLDFPLVASGTASAASGYDLYAFAGTNCDQGSTYVSPGVAGGTCWPIVNGPIAYNLNAGFIIGIRARQILAQYTLAVKQVYSTVATGSDSPVCHIQPTSAALQISVYFVFGTSMALATVGGTSGAITVNADLAAAAPPTTLTLGIGDTVLLPKWNSITDQDIVGYNVYYLREGAPAASTPQEVNCDSGATTTTDSGTVTSQSFTLSALDDGGDDGGDDADADAATDAATTAAIPQTCYLSTPINATPLADAGVPYHPNGVDCPSPFPPGSTNTESDGGVIAGTDADVDSVDTTGDDGSVGTISTAASVADISMQPREVLANKYPFVAATGNTATSATLTGLADDVEYVVGVAATDAYGNVGALSTFNGTDMICQWPQQVTDFFDSYRSGGGLAGCALEAPEVPSGAGGSALVFGAALVFALRRRRR